MLQRTMAFGNVQPRRAVLLSLIIDTGPRLANPVQV
jgi:hypothetical protein